MKKSILFILTIAISLSIMGCEKKSVTPEREKEFTESVQTEKSNMDIQNVQDLIFTVNAFKGNASSDNVRELYTEIKPMLSEEVQAIYEKVNIPNYISARRFNGCDIRSWIRNPEMEYNGRGYNGYTIYCLVEYIEESTQKKVRFKTESDIIDYNGKALLIRDKDMEEISKP